LKDFGYDKAVNAGVERVVVVSRSPPVIDRVVGRGWKRNWRVRLYNHMTITETVYSS